MSSICSSSVGPICGFAPSFWWGIEPGRPQVAPTLRRPGSTNHFLLDLTTRALWLDIWIHCIALWRWGRAKRIEAGALVIMKWIIEMNLASTAVVGCSLFSGAVIAQWGAFAAARKEAAIRNENVGRQTRWTFQPDLLPDAYRWFGLPDIAGLIRLELGAG
jgi:hypothetical protein